MDNGVSRADDSTDPQYDAVVVGAGLGGIYQLYRLLDLGAKVTVLEASPGLGGTWYANRYPGARFDSESFTYGYSFSRELLDTWHWKERFSDQPENLRYLEYVADMFDLRRYMQFDCRVEQARWNEDACCWEVQVADGRTLTCRLLITAVGQLSIPTPPKLKGRETFQGLAFHTHDWPHEGVDIKGKRVGVIGTGATGVQLICAIADQVGELTVFQRRPNWCAPLKNSPISDEEMEDIRSRYDDIFASCARSPAGFLHEPDRRPFFEVPREERIAKWEKAYGEPGFGIWLANFREIFTDEEANAEFSDFIAGKIRQRVNDPGLAEKLIPKDHGFGYQRVPLETNYYETYNRDNVTLVDLLETPIETVTETGIRTTDREYDLDIIVYATGFDAITGAYDHIDFRGVDDQRLADKWKDGPISYMGLTVNGFPNLLFVAGPQSASAYVNYPRGIETSVNWVSDLVQFMDKHDFKRIEATAESEAAWMRELAAAQSIMLIRKGKGWFTGYNSNVEGHENPTPRFLVYSGGAPKYRKMITAVADAEYGELQFD
jgi:cation diffusion facilitator CzcD-associated flavoprotein CzcO